MRPEYKLIETLPLDFCYPSVRRESRHAFVLLGRDMDPFSTTDNKVFWRSVSDYAHLNRCQLPILENGLGRLRKSTLLQFTALKLLPPTFRVQHARVLFSQLWGKRIEARSFKAWLRRRHALVRTGPGRYTLPDEPHRQWLDPF